MNLENICCINCVGIEVRMLYSVVLMYEVFGQLLKLELRRLRLVHLFFCEWIIELCMQIRNIILV